MAKWAEDMRIEQFFRDAEKDIGGCGTALQELPRKRLRAAREFMQGETALQRLLKMANAGRAIEINHAKFILRTGTKLLLRAFTVKGRFVSCTLRLCPGYHDRQPPMRHFRRY